MCYRHLHTPIQIVFYFLSIRLKPVFSLEIAICLSVKSFFDHPLVTVIYNCVQRIFSEKVFIF